MGKLSDTPLPTFEAPARHPYAERVNHLQRNLTERAKRAVSSTAPPRVDAGRRTDQADIDEARARSALELSLRIGESLLALGVPAADVTTNVLRVAAAYGLRCQVDTLYTSISVSSARPDGPPLTGLRVVKARLQDYTRLHAVSELAQEITRGVSRAPDPDPDPDEPAPEPPVDVEEAHRRLDLIVGSSHPYRRSVVTLALAGMAAAVGFLLGGGWAVALVAAVVTAAIDWLTRLLSSWGMPGFFQQVLGAALSTGAAVVLVLLDVPIRTSLVVGSGIVVLLAGLSFVGAAEDAISGFYVTAAGRFFEVVTLTTGIVVGIAGVLDIATRMGVPMLVFGPGPITAHVVIQFSAAAAIAGCFAIASYARPRAALIAAGAGGLGWAASYAAIGLGSSWAVAAFVAATVVGFVGDAMHDRLHVPPLLVGVCGIVSLLPGLTIYDGMFAIVVEANIDRGLGRLVEAGAIALGLAAGVTLGEFLATPVRRSMDGFERAVRRHAMTVRG